MANPTTNYGFVLPTPTDLVTDLPADFEVALQGVDTQMKTNADAAIAKTIVDAKGDLIAATAADTLSRLAVGTNNQVLTADSTAATGLKWATVPSGGMTLLSTTSLSGATTTISSIDQSYNSLYFVVTGVTNATGNGRLRIAPNASTNITCAISLFNTDAIWDYRPADYLYLALTNTLRTNSSNAWSGIINNYTSTSTLKTFEVSGIYFNDNSVFMPYVTDGGINTTSAITSLVFSNSGGNLSTGTVLLYGVK